MTLHMLTEPEMGLAGAAVGAPVTDWSLYDTHYTERFMSTPEANPEGYAASDVVDQLDRMTGRLLLMHGMAVVDQRGRTGGVLEVQRGQLFFHGVADVDRALRRAACASLKTRLQFAPMGGTVFALVFPMGASPLGIGPGGSAQRQRGHGEVSNQCLEFHGWYQDR